MTRDQIIENIRKMVQETGTEANVTDDMILFYDASQGGHHSAIDRGEAGLDSLDMVELVMNVEETFEIDVPDCDVEDNPNWTTIAGIASYVESRLEQEGR
jgi:acyl carrier protein